MGRILMIPIPINSKTLYSHDWSLFEEVGFIKTRVNLILPEWWQIYSNRVPVKQLLELQSEEMSRGIIWCNRDGIAESVRIFPRYVLFRRYKNKNKFVFYCVQDRKWNIPVFITTLCRNNSEEAVENFEKCMDFLKSNYPDFLNPVAYWNN